MYPTSRIFKTLSFIFYIFILISKVKSNENERKLARDIVRRVSSLLRLQQVTLLVPDNQTLSTISSAIVTEIVNEFPTTVLKSSTITSTSDNITSLSAAQRRLVWLTTGALGVLLAESRSGNETEVLLRLAEQLRTHSGRPSSRLLAFLVGEQPNNRIEDLLARLHKIGFPRITVLEILCGEQTQTLNLPTGCNKTKLRLHSYNPAKGGYSSKPSQAWAMFAEEEEHVRFTNYDYKRLMPELIDEEDEFSEFWKYFLNMLLMFGNIVGLAIFMAYLRHHLHLNDDFWRIYNVLMISG